MTGPTFDADDVNELGVEGCMKVWERIQRAAEEKP
jgi:hypothetical protein